MNYLKSTETLEECLDLFIKEGINFNGTNLAVGSVDQIKVAHNYGTGEPLNTLPIDKL